jgi:hypothetical protein
LGESLTAEQVEEIKVQLRAEILAELSAQSTNDQEPTEVRKLARSFWGMFDRSVPQNDYESMGIAYNPMF